MSEPAYVEDVYSFTKQETAHITVLKKFLPSGEKVLIIDDFLANGEAALGMARIVEKAGSTVAGIGIAIEKAFQKGHSRLIEAGYHLEALASIASLEDGKVTFTKK
jgi:xanthine phosphoribosyltransferase